MARLIPTDRFSAVVAAAAQVFITHGYHRARIQDVADALGLGKGTLYGYAQSKAALFGAAVRYADGHDPLPTPADLPVPAPTDGEVAAIIAGRLAAEITDLHLATALAHPLPAGATAADDDAELAAIITDLYARLAKHRVAIKLVDRCAPELPELAEVWFGTGRRAHVSAVEEYLTRRHQAGTLTLPGPAQAVNAILRPVGRYLSRQAAPAVPSAGSPRPVPTSPASRSHSPCWRPPPTATPSTSPPVTCTCTRATASACPFPTTAWTPSSAYTPSTSGPTHRKPSPISPEPCAPAADSSSPSETAKTPSRPDSTRTSTTHPPRTKPHNGSIRPDSPRSALSRPNVSAATAWLVATR